MIIENIKLTKNRKTIILSAFCNSKYLYFKIPSVYSSFINPDASSFLAALLIPSMSKGENLLIKSNINQKTYKNTAKLMEIIHNWDVGLKPITVSAKETSQDKQNSKYQAVFFSGGVDSFYSYLKHKKQITHLILVHGFDIPLNNKPLWKTTLKNSLKIAKQANIKLIPVETNLREIIDPLLDWGMSHGGALASVALLLRNKFKKVYIGSSYDNKNLFPWGSHPKIDPLWSTEKLQITHHGNGKTRIEKVNFISKFSIALDNLRVCWQNASNFYNCGKCEKCLRTMINLKIANKLDQAKTFPHQIDIESLKKIEITNKHETIYLKEILENFNLKDEQLTQTLEYLVYRKKIPLKTLIIQKIVELDKKYNQRKLNLFLHQFQTNGQRPKLFKLLNNLRII